MATPLAQRPRLWIAGIAVVLLSATGAGAITSTAFFRDSARTKAAVASGTIAIGVSGGQTATRAFAATGVGVGYQSAVYQRLIVTNTGTSALRYAITSSSTNALSPLIAFDVASISSSTTCNQAGFSGGTTISKTASSLGTGTSAEQSVVGSKSRGAQAGDQDLAAAAAQYLCLRVYVRNGAGRGAAGASGITSAFTVYAEQTRNNP